MNPNEPRKFFECDGCRLELFCNTCRDTGPAGVAFRESQLKQHTDLTERDWACPKGKTFYDAATQPFTAKPNFFTHPICTGQKNCQLCRSTSPLGMQWRQHMRRMFLGADSDLFKCPLGKQWIEADTDTPVIVPTAAAAPVPAFTREYLDTRIKVENAFDTLPERLPEGSVYRNHLLDARNRGGCTGCRRNRLINWLTDEIAKATGTDKETLLNALNDTSAKPSAEKAKETEHAG